MPSYRLPKTIKITFEDYSSEAKAELKELAKLKLMVANGRMKEQKVFISIDKPEAIEIRIYDLSNFSVNVYHDFNKRIKKLLE